MLKTIDLNKKTPTLPSKLAEGTRNRRSHNRGLVEVERSGAMPRRNDLTPTLKLETRAVGDVRPAKRRLHKDEPGHLAEVMRSLTAFGQVVPILIKADGEIIDGHFIHAALCMLEVTHISCIVIDHLEPEELRLLKLALNRIEKKGVFDVEILKIEFLELQALGIDLEVTGFDAEEIDIVVNCVDWDDGKADELPKLGQNYQVTARLGDVFQLGSHVVLCGDALDPESYVRLMDGAVARLINTDMPYPVTIPGFVSGKGRKQHEDFIGSFGKMSREEFADFVGNAIRTMAPYAMNGALGLFFMDFRGVEALLNAGRQNGLQLINLIVWNKGRGGMGSMYRSAHELAPLFKFGDAPHCNRVQLGKFGRDRTNVWTYPGASQPGSSANKMLAEHPTPKNVECLRDSILDTTDVGDIVLDPFAGSGSILIAAEQCGRSVRAMELDPKFVDVIVRRWEKFSGKAGIHVASSMTFEELTAHRASDSAHSIGSDGETGGPDHV